MLLRSFALCAMLVPVYVYGLCAFKTMVVFANSPVDPGWFDNPEILALIKDLDLVLRPLTPSELETLRRPLFCQRYKWFLDEKKRLRDILCREVYKRNKKYSRHVYASYKDN